MHDGLIFHGHAMLSSARLSADDYADVDSGISTCHKQCCCEYSGMIKYFMSKHNNNVKVISFCLQYPYPVILVILAK